MHHITEIALVKVTNNLFAQNKWLFSILLELSVTSDYINYQIQLQGLGYLLGIKWIVLPWFKSYFSTDLSLYMLTRSHWSPQDSALGLLLYYNNIYCYADDTHFSLPEAITCVTFWQHKNMNDLLFFADKPGQNWIYCLVIVIYWTLSSPDSKTILVTGVEIFGLG